MSTLTAKHYAILRVAKTQLGLSDEDYRAILSRLTGRDSAKGLDLRGFGKVMAQFELLGFQSTATKKDAARRPGMASEAQLRKINGLWAEFTGSTGDETSLRHWMESHGHGHGPRWLDNAGANKVIGALTNMVQRRQVRRVEN